MSYRIRNWSEYNAGLKQRGSVINNLTLQHMYTLHSYMLAISALLLSITHLTALIVQEQSWKPRQFRFSLTKLCGDTPKRDASSPRVR